jgi:ribonuclease P protein component
VFELGLRRRTPRLDLVWRPNDTNHPRLGVIVPRYGATAVARNRLRRRIREAARRDLLPNLSPIDLVVRARPAAYRSSTAQLADDLERWLRSVSE